MDNAGKAAVRRARLEAAKVASAVIPGLVKSAVWASGLPVTVVTVGGIDFTNLPVVGSQNLLPGQVVNVLQTSGSLVVLGPATADVQPAQGTVTATGTGKCQVSVTYSSGTRTVLCPWVAAYTPTIGDVVLLRWVAGTAVIEGKLSQALPTSLTPPYVPTPPPTALPSGTYGMSIFPAFFTGSSPVMDQINWTPGGLHSDDNTVGSWFYGSTVADSMVGKVVDTSRASQIFFPDGDTPDGFGLVWSEQTYPGPPAPAAGEAYPPLPALRGWVDMDDFSIEKIVSAYGSFGIIAPAGKKAFLQGLNEYPLSGALRIYWVTV